MRNTNRARALALAVLALIAFGVPRAVAQEATLDALDIAWNRELNAALHYSAFARAALRDGYPKIATLFCAVAEAESIHATNHRIEIERLDGGTRRAIESVVVHSCAQNLARAIELEVEEWTTLYPRLAKIARGEFMTDALASFNWARSAEKTHADIFAAALADLNERAPGSRFLVSLVPVALPEPPPSRCPVALICAGCGSAWPEVPGPRCPNCRPSSPTLLEPDCRW